MIPYQEFNIPKLKCRKDEKGNKFYNDIFCFDIEVTSFFQDTSGKWGTAYNMSADDCKNAIQCVGVPYIWQFGFNDNIIYGRELSDFVLFLKQFHKINPFKKYIYVHFLAYEFHFLSSFLTFDKVFARKPHIPIYATVADLNIEFRCSYVLTNMALAKLQANYNLPVTKKDGQLNYDIPRLPNTELSSQELEYCEFDIIVMYELLKQFRIKYESIPNIPLTQTGEIRRVVKNTVLNGYKHLNRIKEMYPDLSDYKKLTRVFAGGYTHANYIYNGEIIENVYSFDRASSYPAVMVTKLFPMTRFKKCENSYTRRKNYCYISYISISNFKSKSAWDYISEHKCEVRNNVSVDNGRIIAGDYVELWITDVDYDILMSCYDGEIKIIENYRALKGYLPIKFIEFILEQYVYKTTLKGVEDKKDLYLKAKQFINALYGMCVTNDVRDEVLFIDNSRWKVEELNDTQISEKLNKEHFLNFSWGVFITAYARQELWKLISKIGNDVLYVDTDSVKFINLNSNLHYITEYNAAMIDELKTTSNLLGIDLNKFMPKLKSKIGMCAYPLGVFEYECCYSQFKTYGAKKYAYTYAHNGKFGFTVAGCIKSYYDWNEKDVQKRTKPTIKSLDDFKLGHAFQHGRKIMKYICNQPCVELHDLQGHTYINQQRTGIISYTSTYTLGLSVSYETFLGIYNSTSTHNKYSTPYRLFY